jgi:hypothetical protein
MTGPSTSHRTVTLVLVDAAGEVLGALAPIDVEMPCWNAASPVLEAVRARDGLNLTILRLLSAERAAPPGGAVSYLAQVESPIGAVQLQPWSGELPEHPMRNTYARVGGPQADLAWARQVLESQGLSEGGPAEQVRTWNLSSLWRLPLKGGSHAWLKAVPPFFAHEGAVLRRLAGERVPRLLGHDGSRMLLAEAPGEDLYDANEAQALAMIDLLVDLQTAWQGRAEDLLALGLPDWRGPAMTASLGALFERRAGELPRESAVVLDRFLLGLDARFAAISACGLMDGLVHGDFHRGNCRGDAHSLTLLDWGDSGVGHPLLDMPAFLTRMPEAMAQAARAHWRRAWQWHHPKADVSRAEALLAPVASARQALIYQKFLDGIEDAEHPYHRDDVVDWLGRTAAVLQSQTPLTP